VTLEKKYAEVTNVDDPDRLGRIKVKCAAILADEIELPDWIEPKFAYVSPGKIGWFSVPEIGSIVEIEYPISSAYDEFAAETQLHMNDWRYVCTTYSDAQELPEIFKTNYPKRAGQVYPNGWMVYFDYSDNSPHIFLGYAPDGTSPKLWVKITDSMIEVSTDSGEKLTLDQQNQKATMEVPGSKFDAAPAEAFMESGGTKFSAKGAGGSVISPKVNLGAEVAPIPALQGTSIIAAFTTYFASIIVAANALGSVPDPTGVAAQLYGQAIAAATTLIQGTLATWPSTVVGMSG
jgi:hypothetical protein